MSYLSRLERYRLNSRAGGGVPSGAVFVKGEHGLLAYVVLSLSSSAASRLPAALPQLATPVDVLGLLLLGLVDVAGVARRQLKVSSAGRPGLQLAAPLQLDVQLGAEEQREVGDPQPEQEDHDAGEAP